MMEYYRQRLKLYTIGTMKKLLLYMFYDKNPFYAESGGQVSDTGN